MTSPRLSKTVITFEINSAEIPVGKASPIVPALTSTGVLGIILTISLFGRTFAKSA